MGYNTTVIILNDALDQIKKDPLFAEKLYDACRIVSRGKQVDVSAGNHCNAATVIETHHADMDQPVIIGGNCGHPINLWEDPEKLSEQEINKEINLLTLLARKHGFSLQKKPTSKVK